MGDFEIILLIAFVVYAGYVWWRYYSYLLQVNRMLYQGWDCGLLLFAPVVCGVVLLFVLKYFADSYVRTHNIYIVFYWLLGMAWLGLAQWFLPFLGFSLRDDGLERRNSAATIALCGAFIGITAAYAGGNIGDGPGWWVVLACVSLSTISFFLAWLVLEYFTQISETITIERNLAAGARLAVILIVVGIILGRAVTGDWHGYADLVRLFLLRAWYVVPLLIIAVFIEWNAKPTVESPNPAGMKYSLYPIIAYVVIIVIALLLRIPSPVPM